MYEALNDRSLASCRTASYSIRNVNAVSPHGTTTPMRTLRTVRPPSATSRQAPSPSAAKPQYVPASARLAGGGGDVAVHPSVLEHVEVRPFASAGSA